MIVLRFCILIVLFVGDVFVDCTVLFFVVLFFVGMTLAFLPSLPSELLAGSWAARQCVEEQLLFASMYQT